MHFDGVQWQEQDSGIRGAWDNVPATSDLWGTAADDLWLVAEKYDSGGGISHWDGLNWTSIQTPGRVSLSQVWGDERGRMFFLAPALGPQGFGILETTRLRVRGGAKP